MIETNLLVALFMLTQSFGPSSLKPGFSPSVVTPQFLNAVAQVESHNKTNCVGDKGRSRGAYQMKVGAWRTVNALIEARDFGLKKAPYKSGSFDATISRNYSYVYCRFIENSIYHCTHQPPTAEEVYAGYVLGITRFRQSGFKLNCFTKAVQNKCKKVATLARQKI